MIRYAGVHADISDMKKLPKGSRKVFIFLDSFLKSLYTTKKLPKGSRKMRMMLAAMLRPRCWKLPKGSRKGMLYLWLSVTHLPG